MPPRKDLIVFLKAIRARAEHVPLNAAHDAHYYREFYAAMREMKTANLGAEAMALEKKSSQFLKHRDFMLHLDKLTAKLKPGGMSSLVHFLSELPERGVFHPHFRQFSMADWNTLFGSALRLMGRAKPPSEGLIANMSGITRELAAKHLPEVVAAKSSIVQSVRNAAAGSRERCLIDTTLLGPIELPTLLKAGQREIKLGSDWWVGQGTLDAHAIKAVIGGVEQVVPVAGRLRIRMVAEVKGTSNAMDGLEQMTDLGGRALPGYAYIDKKFWLIEYDPESVLHLVIAPAGARLQSVQKAIAGSKIRIEAVEIPHEIEQQVVRTSEFVMSAAGVAMGKNPESVKAMLKKP